MVKEGGAGGMTRPLLVAPPLKEDSLSHLPALDPWWIRGSAQLAPGSNRGRAIGRRLATARAGAALEHEHAAEEQAAESAVVPVEARTQNAGNRQQRAS